MRRVNTILGFQNRASTQPRAQTFDIPLDGDCRIGTPIRQNLVKYHMKGLLYEYKVISMVSK